MSLRPIGKHYADVESTFVQVGSHRCLGEGEGGLQSTQPRPVDDRASNAISDGIHDDGAAIIGRATPLSQPHEKTANAPTQLPGLINALLSQ